MGSRDKLLKVFTRKQLYIYFITNLLINAVIPYFGFEDRHAVSLFHGAHSMARFLIPMSVFVPFGITFDILKKCITFSEKNGLTPLLPEGYARVPFMLKLAGVNALATGGLVLGLMWIVHITMPAGYRFEGSWLALISGGIAGGLAILFTWLPLYVVKKLPSA
ncbi:hypothetical protein [Chitinophaga sancti]|uniref:hypothetical protein n=1 Tax=Chitinophaga sancti TaxID=1004 RepID=UPI003F7941A6